MPLRAARFQMKMPLVVIISGPPCTGKTTLGQRIAAELRLPFLSKDRIKERLFDTLGVGDREWSKRLGAASMELLSMLAEMELTAGRSFVVEANFQPAWANRQFQPLQEKYPFKAFQLQCRADIDALLARFKRRIESGERHPGHLDHVTYPEIVAVLSSDVYGPMDLEGAVYELDTTDFAKVDYEGLLEAIKVSVFSTLKVSFQSPAYRQGSRSQPHTP